jgi:hypothetical protein
MSDSNFNELRSYLMYAVVSCGEDSCEVGSLVKEAESECCQLKYPIKPALPSSNVRLTCSLTFFWISKSSCTSLEASTATEIFSYISERGLAIYSILFPTLDASALLIASASRPQLLRLIDIDLPSSFSSPFFDFAPGPVLEANEEG